MSRGLLASDLVSALTAIIAEHGDMPVAYCGCEYGPQSFGAPTVESGWCDFANAAIRYIELPE